MGTHIFCISLSLLSLKWPLAKLQFEFLKDCTQFG
ncbi:Uncharacterised protein [Vibrio cholerae]|nr:Uncharacterised protein [Vibrio cholerae]